MSRVIKSSEIIFKTVDEPNNNESIEKIINKEKELLKLAKEQHDSIIFEAEIKAKEILEDAHGNADSLINQAKQESERIEYQAQQQGYEEGFNKGYEEGKSESDQLIVEANHIKESYLLEQKRVIESIEGDTIQLVLTVCEDILYQKLDQDKETIISVIKKGLENLSASQRVTIRVSTNDYDIVELSKDRLLAMSSKIETIQVKSDSSLSPGDCMIDTPKGSIDASVEKQMQQVRNIVLDLLNNSE